MKPYATVYDHVLAQLRKRRTLASNERLKLAALEVDDYIAGRLQVLNVEISTIEQCMDVVAQCKRVAVSQAFSMIAQAAMELD